MAVQLQNRPNRPRFLLCSIALIIVASGCLGHPTRHAPKIERQPTCEDIVARELHARGKNMSAAGGDEVAAIVCRQARRAGLDPLLALALVDLESGFDAGIISSRGAMGLMQLMPPTALAVAKRHALATPAAGPLDPAFNVTLGLLYLDDLRQEFQSLDRALLAYNIGPPALYSLLRSRGPDYDAAAAPFVGMISQRLAVLHQRYPDPLRVTDSAAP